MPANTAREADISPDGQDRSLRALLADCGSTLDEQQLRQVVSGVAAAPPGYEQDAWMHLVADEPSPQLRLALSLLLDQARTARKPPALSQGGMPEEVAHRLVALREELSRRGLAGFVVPRSDEHQGEYVAAYAERLAWLTGFTGSAGTAVVLNNRAALFVDGRYTVQAAAEVDASWFTIHHSTHEPMSDWLARELPASAGVASDESGSTGGKSAGLGYDPWLHTPAQVEHLRSACARAGARAVPVTSNPIDRVWRDRPPPPIAPVVPHPLQFAGESSVEKRARIAEELRQQHQDAAFLAQPAAIAWLLNIRGGDLPYMPTPLAFAILHADARVELFLDPRKLTAAARMHLDDSVTVVPPDSLAAALDRLGTDRRTVRVDPEAAPEWVARRLRRAGATIAEAADPCALPKATKTPVEVRGIRAAHVRDGAALTRFLAWLPAAAASGTLTESAAADRLAAFRAPGAHFRGLSFPTISAAAGNGAIVHYRVSAATDRRLKPGSLYLVDSGAQYLDGTTDVTRTVAIGEPSAEMCERFTLVLKGHIALARARFPRGTTGSQIDVFARMAMWREGFDYDHGTGHGVGMYLGVHEGPQRISKLPSRVALQPGMVISNEPGYYKPGAYGIRIENLVTVKSAEQPEGAEIDLLEFETLTLAPIDRRLIVTALLGDDEVGWLDAYHARVRETLAPLLDAASAAWLSEATRLIRG